MFVTSDGFLHSSSNGLKWRIFGAQGWRSFRANTVVIMNEGVYWKVNLWTTDWPGRTQLPSQCKQKQWKCRECQIVTYIWCKVLHVQKATSYTYLPWLNFIMTSCFTSQQLCGSFRSGHTQVSITLAFWIQSTYGGWIELCALEFASTNANYVWTLGRQDSMRIPFGFEATCEQVFWQVHLVPSLYMQACFLSVGGCIKLDIKSVEVPIYRFPGMALHMCTYHMWRHCLML